MKKVTLKQVPMKSKLSDKPILLDYRMQLIDIAIQPADSEKNIGRGEMRNMRSLYQKLESSENPTVEEEVILYLEDAEFKILVSKCDKATYGVYVPEIDLMFEEVCNSPDQKMEAVKEGQG